MNTTHHCQYFLYPLFIFPLIVVAAPTGIRYAVSLNPSTREILINNLVVANDVPTIPYLQQICASPLTREDALGMIVRGIAANYVIRRSTQLLRL